jgi:competence protein ComEA
MAALVKWVVGAVIGVILVIVAFTQIDPNIQNNQGGVSIISSTETVGTIDVTIEGQVAHPGTYTVDENLTILDLVNLAGGYLTSADLDAINDSLVLKGRSLVYVPIISGYSQECVIDPDARKFNVNTATKEELMEVNGISEVLAERIVAYREENGMFESLEDLMNVVGIGTKTYEKIRDFLTLK